MADDSTVNSSEQVLEAVWTKFEAITSPTSRLRPEKQPKSPFGTISISFTAILSVLWVILLVMAVHSTSHNPAQVLEAVWTKFEPITSPTSRVMSKKLPKTAKIAIF